MRLELRKAGPADLDCLAAMNRMLIEDEGSANPMTVQQLRERMAAWLAADWEIELLVEEETVVGYALFQFRGHPYDSGKRNAYLRQYFVRPEYRGRGVGRQGIDLLLRKSLHTADTIGIDVLESNPRGMRFWRQVGFAPYCRTMTRPGGGSPHGENYT